MTKREKLGIHGPKTLHMNDNLVEIGFDEETWYRIWYDLYNIGLMACNPQHPTVLYHFAHIPNKYLMKFNKELYKRMDRKNKKQDSK